jgi:HlyD family secretion protein
VETYRSVVLIVTLLVFAGCSKSEEPAGTNTEAPVQVAEATSTEIHRIVTAEGVLYPIAQATIVPKISAPVRTFHVNRGDHVRQGQLLAELESRDLAAAVAEAKSQYEQAQSAFRATTNASLPEDIRKAQLDVDTAKQALDAAQKVYESRQELLRQGAIARRSVDEANLAYVEAKNQLEAAQRHLDTLQNVGRQEQTANAQAQMDAAKARYDAAQAQLSYARIESPIDGVVTDRPLYAGEMATPDKPLITVMDASRVVARVNVPNAQLSFIKIGQVGAISSESVPGELDGKVTVISPALDPNSTTAEVWVEANNPNGEFHPGSTVQVSIITETVKDATVVPVAALLPSDEGGSIVMVVNQNSIAEERRIEIGIREDGKVQILKGVAPGEKVVTVGGLGLEDQAKVKVETGEKDDEKKDEKK